MYAWECYKGNRHGVCFSNSKCKYSAASAGCVGHKMQKKNLHGGKLNFSELGNSLKQQNETRDAIGCTQLIIWLAIIRITASGFAGNMLLVGVVVREAFKKISKRWRDCEWKVVF